MKYGLIYKNVIYYFGKEVENMKAVVISDIHGSGYYAEKIKEINERENPDKIILLGDLYYHGPRNELSQEYKPMKVAEILNSLKDKLLVVRGNCDAEVDEMISDFKFNGAMASHSLSGHTMGVAASCGS